jgi:hypothetical protein
MRDQDALRQFMLLLDVDRCQLIRFDDSGAAEVTLLGLPGCRLCER